MTSLAAIEARIDAFATAPVTYREDAETLLRLAEEVLEYWLDANGKVPVTRKKEGFRLLALHAQSAKGDPSFNACRETCREIAYRYNLAMSVADVGELTRAVATMRRLVQHLSLFISGKCQSAQLGEFCCASRPLRQTDSEMLEN
ncbi:MAG: hypothetical protein R3C00_04835 [Hyphomonas sp.]|nr:hypothetical protein [Hyphomonas sp.]MCB9971270.1 hypothetical protein [Hyphomonas sp.]